MGDVNGTTAEIRAYLEREFPGAAIRHESIPATGDALFLVDQNGLAYRLHVLHEFLNRHAPEHAVLLLRKWKLADEMRRMEDMGLALGEAGIRLESSN